MLLLSCTVCSVCANNAPVRFTLCSMRVKVEEMLRVHASDRAKL